MKFKNFRLGTVYAYTDSGYCIKYEKVLVDPENNKLIDCSYSLKHPKGTETDGVDCRLMDIPMKIIDTNTVEVSHHTLIHKYNSGHYKKVKYEDLVLELGHLNFAVHM